MMKNLFLLIAGISISGFANSQEEIVRWTFPTGQLTDTIQNSTNILNLTSAIRSEGTVAISMTNGQTTGDYAATATGWENGVNVKNWYIIFKTTGYNNVKISSKQRAGGTNGGPKDFTLQFKIGESGTWTDVAGGTVVLANNWTGAVDNLILPAECQNQSSLIYIRWVMSSNADVNSGNVTSNGISKIDEIIVTGDAITNISENKLDKIFDIYPNPSKGNITINTNSQTEKINIYNLTGSLKISVQSPDEFTNIFLLKGIYFIQIHNKNSSFTKKIIIE